ncbi:hypothetical protein ACVWXO_009425 [Bradyrhizobium sp. LM2.7]
MTIAQDAGKQGEAEGLKDTAQNKASQISSTSDKDALGESSLDDVSGGAWPNSTTKTTVVPPTI